MGCCPNHQNASYISSVVSHPAYHRHVDLYCNVYVYLYGNVYVCLYGYVYVYLYGNVAVAVSVGTADDAKAAVAITRAVLLLATSQHAHPQCTQHVFYHPTPRVPLTLHSPVLLGPFRGVTYLVEHGLPALAIAAMWSAKAPWLVSVPVAALARTLGTLLNVVLATWVLN